jgi:peptide/nickel transport system substrate-binding protein
VENLGAGLVALFTVLMVACGAAAPATPAPSDGASAEPTAEATPTQELARPTELAIQSTATPAPEQPTPTPAPTAAPTQAESAKDTVIIVTNEEPTTIGAASSFCGGNIQNTVCDDMLSDPLTFIDDRNNFQVVGLTGIQGWEQLESNRWRFHLRDNVVFHNGAPWNAEQAKFWIDWFGDEATSGHHNSNDFSFHGVISGEVVDPLTLDVVCGVACPILPRTTIFTKFQDVEWFQNATPEQIESMTVGLGPYKIVEWRRGVEVELEAFEDYNPNPNTIYSQAPSIKRVIQRWRNEPTVRAAVIASGEADWADIPLESREQVPQWKSATNNEIYIYAIDTVYHPELRKKKVRQALALAIDCETAMREIFQDLLQCYGNISQPGTIGITPENSAPYGYDPERARQLLQEANYDPNNVIKLHTRSNRVPKDVEYGEAVVTFWRDVGINAELQVVESAVRSNISYSNCGNQDRQKILNAPGANLHEKCRGLGPPGPTFASMHVTESGTSTESLDYSRQLLLRNSCFSRSSGVCFSNLEEAIQEAIITPTGPERRQKMETLATRVHDEYYFHPNFQVVTIYGMSANLEWEPYYSPRIRANTMSFSQ